MVIIKIFNIVMIIFIILSVNINCINKFFNKKNDMNEGVYITVGANLYVLDRHPIAMYIYEYDDTCIDYNKLLEDCNNKIYKQWIRNGYPVIYINAFGGKGVPIFYFNMIIPYCKKIMGLNNKQYKIPVEITIDFKKKTGGRYINYINDDESNSFVVIRRLENYIKGEFNSELIKLGTNYNEKIKITGNFILKLIEGEEELLKYEEFMKNKWNEMYQLYEGE